MGNPEEKRIRETSCSFQIKVGIGLISFEGVEFVREVLDYLSENYDLVVFSFYEDCYSIEKYLAETSLLKYFKDIVSFKDTSDPGQVLTKVEKKLEDKIRFVVCYTPCDLFLKFFLDCTFIYVYFDESSMGYLEATMYEVDFKVKNPKTILKIL